MLLQAADNGKSTSTVKLSISPFFYIVQGAVLKK